VPTQKALRSVIDLEAFIVPAWLYGPQGRVR